MATICGGTLYGLCSSGALAQTSVSTTQSANGVPLVLGDPLSFTVTTSGTGSAGYGLWAQGSAGQITADTPSLLVQSTGSIAAVAQGGGRITLGGTGTPALSLTSTNTLQALLSTGTGSQVTLTGGTVGLTLATGSGNTDAAAVLAQSGGGVSLNGTQVSTVSTRTGAGNFNIVGVEMLNAGSHVDLSSVAISSTINNSTSFDAVYGIYATAGTLTGSNVNIRATRNSSNQGSAVVSISNAGTSASLSDFSLIGSGSSVGGAYALSSASVTLTRGTINVPVSAYNANLSGSQLTATDVDATASTGTAGVGNTASLMLVRGSVTSTGSDTTTLAAVGGGKAVLTGTTITQQRGISAGTGTAQALWTNGNNSRIDGSGITVKAGTLGGANLSALYAQVGGVISLSNGSTITLQSAATTGTPAGAWATGTNTQTSSLISLTDATMTVSGTNVRGLRADTGGRVTLRNTQLSTAGNGGIGAEVIGATASVALSNGSSISTTGTLNTVTNTPATGISVSNGGTITVDGSTVSVTGAGSPLFMGSGSGAANTATFTNSTLSSRQGDALTATANTNTISASNTHISGQGALLSATGAGTVLSLSATNGSQLQGAAQLGTGATSSLSLASGSVWTLSGPSALSTLALDAGTVRYGVATPPITVGAPIQLNAGGGTFDTNGFDNTLATVLTGPGGLTKAGAGVLTLSVGNIFTGGTWVSGGTLAIANDASLGNSAGLLTLDGGTLRTTADIDTPRNVTLGAGGGGFETMAGTQLVLNTPVTGPGALTKTGDGTLVLADTETYSGGTTVSAGTLQIGNNTFTGAVAGDIVDNATVAFARTNVITYGGVISGSGALRKLAAGTLHLTGANTYTGPTSVEAGALYVDGSTASALTTVNGGATLGGTGTIGGSVNVTSGATLAPGASGSTPGTLTINGDLTLDSGAILTYRFGQANTVGGPLNDLAVVHGNLTLAGTLDVSTTPGGSFDTGIYRVISYDGTLTNHGLAVGTVPSPDYYVQTSIPNQVNLINTRGLTLNFWDGAAGPRNNGAVDGGSGTWQSGSGSGNDNWTSAEGAVNAPFSNGAFAVFMGTPGTVTVDDGPGAVHVAGMQFAVDGYHVQGDAITLDGAPASTIRVGDGTSAGTAMTARIDAPLTGAGALVKSDLGTLILGGANSYGGGTVIHEGVLQVVSDANLGAATGTLDLDGGTLRTTADMRTARTTTVSLRSGTLETAAGGTLIHSGSITGEGLLRKTGTGTLELDAANGYSGGTALEAGTLRVGHHSALGTGSLAMAENTTLDFAGSHTLANALTLSGDPFVHVDGSLVATLAGPIGDGSAPGRLEKTGDGTLVLTTNAGYTGGTTIEAGTLQLGDGSYSGTIVGNVLDHGTLAFDRADTLGFDGAISGTGGVAQIGAGTTVLTGANTYSGPTRVQAGTLQAGAANALSAASAHTVAAGATLATGGFDQTVAMLRNAGTVSLRSANNSAGNGVSTLRVNGDYVGQGGLLNMGTVLGTNASITDRLLIGGSASGTTTVQVTNLAGLGGLTRGNGILLISAAQASDAGAFSLQGPVMAGAYEYRLNAAALDAGEGWYLSSTDTTPPSPPAVPLYRPEAAMVSVLPAQLRQMSQSMLGNLHRRMGDETDVTADMPTTDDQPPRRTWARVIASDLDVRQTGTVSPAGAGRFDGFQTGIDLWNAGPEDGNGTHWRTGLYVGQLEGRAQMRGFAGGAWGPVGTNELRSQFLGGYATYTTLGGFYADAVVQWGRHSYTLAPSVGQAATGHGHGTQASVELGQSLALNAHWRIEPQAQAIYQELRLDDLALVGAQVRQRPDGGWIGRLGLRLVGDYTTGAGRVQPYARLNLYRSSQGTDKAVFVGPAAATAIDATAGYRGSEAMAGFTLDWHPGLSAYGEAGRVFGHGGGEQVRSAWQGSLGLRVRW